MSSLQNTYFHSNFHNQKESCPPIPTSTQYHDDLKSTCYLSGYWKDCLYVIRDSNHILSVSHTRISMLSWESFVSHANLVLAWDVCAVYIMFCLALSTYVLFHCNGTQPCCFVLFFSLLVVPCHWAIPIPLPTMAASSSSMQSNPWAYETNLS